jgi:hypothetical protein
VQVDQLLGVLTPVVPVLEVERGGNAVAGVADVQWVPKD